MPLTPIHISRLAYEAFQAGYWFRLEGDRLYVTARRPELPPLSPDMRSRLAAHKVEIIAALRPVPAGCPNRPGHLYVGRCVQAACTQPEADHE
jgi:hypothetical protein